MKVTYEEANKSFEKFYQKNVEGGIISRKTGRKSKLELFLEQHKPPTWEEVVNAWEMCGYKLHKNTDNNLMFRLGGSRLHSFDIYANGKVKISDTIRYIRSDELNAINLTIRYLESQKS